MVSSPLHNDTPIASASIENIIADKFSTCIRFGPGNTRMKDFDDLWRLSHSDMSIDVTKLMTITESRKIELKLKKEWIGPDIERIWKTHQKQYSDLPKNLEELIREINDWIKDLKAK